jgi:hypothetical protein
MKKLKRRLNSGNTGYHFGAEYLVFRFAMKNIKIKIERIEMLRVVLCGCESWSLTLKEKHTLRVLENRVLSKIFGPKGDKVTMKWRRIHNEELNFLYCSLNFLGVIK